MFKRIIETQVPNVIKYLFWSATENKGVFNNYFLEQAIKEGQTKMKKYTKYQIDEMRQKGEIDEWDEINYELNFSVEQYKIIKREQEFVKSQKKKFEALIHRLLQVKKRFFEETANLDETIDKMREVLSLEQ